MTDAAHQTPAADSGAPIAFADVEDAARVLVGHAVETPLLESTDLNARVGGRVLLKCEMLQRTGSFKFRGAFNRIARLSEDELKRGVVAFSSGNHAQAVALAARLRGARATIVMPADSPVVKVEGVRAYGGEIRFYDRWTEDREAIGRDISAATGAVLVPPFDDPFVMAGQGTAGLEIARQAAAKGATPDAVLVCCSGGGLVAGVATAVKALSPTTEVFSVEPEGFDDTRRSLQTGRRETNATGATSVCDALLAPTPGVLTFEANRRLLSGGLVVSDAEALTAVAYAARTLKLVVEPGGAVALAAVLSGKLPVADRTTAVVLSGGNVDARVLTEALL